MNLCTIFIALVALVSFTNCARILGIFHLPSKSHHILGSKLLKTLAENGHEVIMASPYPFKNKVENYRDIFLEDMLQFKEDKLKSMMTHNASFLENAKVMLSIFPTMCDSVLNHNEIQALKQEKIDLVISYAMFSESFLGLAHHLGAPVVLFSTLGGMPPLDRITGNTSPPSYVPSLHYSYLVSEELNFFQRLLNTLATWFNYLVMGPIFDAQQKAVLAKHFPNSPSLAELVDNVSLVFLNSHYSIESPRPYVPNMIQIGGFHVEDAKPLPTELQSYLDSAPQGAVFFSLGSNVKISTLPEQAVRSILSSLGKLNMKVLFKSEIDLTDLPPNIKLGKWLPQSDILGHPNVKLFISHGGLLSTTEAVYHAIPILGIPIFAEQRLNVVNAAEKGYALKIEVDEITEDTFTRALDEILYNPTYRDNVQLRSSLMRDQPIKPLDRAVYWIEHVLKYGGARHLKNSANKLYLFQYLLLDVVAFLIGFAALLGFVSYKILKKLKMLFKSIVRKVKPKQE